MDSKRVWFIGAALLSVPFLMHPAQIAGAAPAAQAHKPVIIIRLFTGPDGQTHSEEIEAKFAPAGGNDIYRLMANSGAELHRAAPGRVADWHTAPRRQYVMTISGHGEIELMGGKKIEVGPGSIELAEDLTGKGHITRTVGNEDRVTIQIPLSDQH
jgi:mannose-6-phosphate isomerase-like protein (cupin superfamily)